MASRVLFGLSGLSLLVSIVGYIIIGTSGKTFFDYFWRFAVVVILELIAFGKLIWHR